MPGLAAVQKNDQLVSNAISSSSYYSLSINNNNHNNGSNSSSSSGFWSKHRDDINYNQLQKFWSELSPQARQELLRIEKHTLFEQARKNMYCSRCNGLLLEGFMQIVMYGKSLQNEGASGQLPCNRNGGISKDHSHSGTCTTPICQDETQDPSVHPWGGLITTRDGALTLLDCYLYSKSLKALQNVFDSARVRERERELLYPDACGGDGRGWISQGIASYGRGHGSRETCALHTAKLSCDTLVDFWSALGEETRHSLLKMKEEDFIERLMYRFDSKRFCRDCRRNVIREFKELKEWKRMRREPRCTNWFCVADTAFQYEVSNDTIHADWHQTFIDSINTYHHFEWAVGSSEGKADILDFENVGMNGSVEVNGLDLDGLNACYITLRAWKLDGRCSEFSVKAHALKGRRCVHCRLTVGDGYVTITRGESIRRFFEHAEEAEEEEDDDSMDKDGNDMDGECSRPQKHAKSPELAREFLLDAATVIFREQVEKAFREGTARQNAHSIFVCLALKLLEERIHVACKEIITYEKQMKLLEEEENEKREEEERKERKRNKEREKKLRRKERLRGKDKDKKCTQINETPISSEISEKIEPPVIDKEPTYEIRDEIRDSIDTNVSELSSPDENTTSDSLPESIEDLKKENNSVTLDNSKGNRWELKGQRDFPQESTVKRVDRRQSFDNGVMAYKSESRYYDETSENLSKGGNYFNNRQPRPSQAKFTNNNSRLHQKVQCKLSCGCNQQNDFREKVYMPKTSHRINKFNQTDYSRDNCGRSKSKISNYYGRDSPYTKKVWEPIEPQKRCPRSNSDSDVTLRKSCDFTEENDSTNQVPKKFSRDSLVDGDNEGKFQDTIENNDSSCLTANCDFNGISEFSATSSSSSDNFSSEGDSNSNTPSLNHQNVESSSITDSGDSSEQSEEKIESFEVGKEKIENIVDRETAPLTHPLTFTSQSQNLPHNHSPMKPSTPTSVQQGPVSSIRNQNLSFPFFHGPSSVGYYHRNTIPWSATSSNGVISYHHPSPYLLTSPIGYGIDPSSNFYMQYGQPSQLTSPFMNGPQIPMYQPIHPTANILTPQEEVFGGRDIGVESRKENVNEGGSDKGNFTKLDPRNSGFSLFQFGGPVALPTYRSNDRSSDEQKLGEISNVEGEHACGKKEGTIEEYNLFANGIQFSIF